MSSTKINVAIAGVSNALGTSIATALVANPAVTVTLLTRASSSSTIPELQRLVDQGAILRQVDYATVESIAEALQGVHTVITTIFIYDDTTPVDNLLEGAKAAGVKRFAPSEFAISKEANSVIQVYDWKITFMEKVKKSGLEYTAFRVGMFMDYFATGSSSYEGPLSPLKMFPLIVDVKERKAEIPGTGNYKVTYTTLTDIGKFVSAAVTLDKWPEEMGMSGETLSQTDIVRKAEAVVGEKFNVTYLSEEDLKRGRVESIEKKDILGQTMMEFFSAFLEGKGEIKDPYLNRATNVQPTNVTEFLRKHWSKE